MDHGALRALVLDANLFAHGVPATFTRPAPDNTPIVAEGIWVTPVTEAIPGNVEFSRREPIRIMAVPRALVPTVPRGTTIVAPEVAGGVNKTWRVDATERVDVDRVRVVVVPVS